ncbi:MAG TPA: saccharopine dehydrogenase C-terminal domain-containing protein, partial [Bacteroidales bacterium]|nr:saccharopine dehydrogenase C-terminal domain-containing protein [Bacteroidales bacterium]HPT01993.1 saccharopine dehydrogenase C-terminal domain-containing protein [Bacteroidales bacterium]
MKKVLILGAGLVVRPIVKHLLSKGIHVTVATRTKSKAEEMIDGHPNGTAVAWTVEDEAKLSQMVSEHDLTVSLLPYVHHLLVAKHCIANKKNMVTTSYVKPEMQALDAAAKEANIIILNESGLDPGIDHMSAMRIIDNVHKKGGKIEEFYSLCGALPAPELADDNPFRYKFSWSPKGVVMAGNNDAMYLKQGKVVKIPTQDLFKNPKQVDFPKVGKLEVYPNRDSIMYKEIYGIPETTTIMRGTFRYLGWCETLDLLKKLKLISYDKVNLEGKTYAQFVAMQIGAADASDIRKKVAAFAGIDVNAYALNAMEWLGYFSNEPVGRVEDSPFEVTSDMMISKMGLGMNERDMVVMQHNFLAVYPDGSKEIIRSRMLDFGTPATDTSIARTVALPAAIAVEMILEGKIPVKGVFRPVL